MGRLAISVAILVLVGAAAQAQAAPLRCRALDANDGALLLEITNASAGQCAAQLEATMKKRRCTRGRAEIEYSTQFDHAGVQGRLVTVPCAVQKAAKRPVKRAVKRTARTAPAAKKKARR